MKQMGKKKGQAAEQQLLDTKQAYSAKQAEHPDAGANAPLTLPDMERLLTSMEDRIITKLSAQLSANRAIIDQHHESIQQLETSLTDTQERLEQLESTCAVLSQANTELKVKLEDLENHARRNNIRIIGLPEKIEGQHPTVFIDELLRETFGPEAFPTSSIADRAHRVAMVRKNSDDTRPRPLIVRIHHFQTKERILKLAREAGSVSFRGSKIHFFPDFSADISRKRAAFVPVKSQLKNAGFNYRMLFPAKLQVTDKGGQKHVFLSPEEVSHFVARRSPTDELVSDSTS